MVGCTAHQKGAQNSTIGRLCPCIACCSVTCAHVSICRETHAKPHSSPQIFHHPFCCGCSWHVQAASYRLLRTHTGWPWRSVNNSLPMSPKKCTSVVIPIAPAAQNSHPNGIPCRIFGRSAQISRYTGAGTFCCACTPGRAAAALLCFRRFATAPLDVPTTDFSSPILGNVGFEQGERGGLRSLKAPQLLLVDQ
jgi:hypothetical protein